MREPGARPASRQGLLAFLLTVPFMQRYDQLDAGDRRIYMVAVLASAVGSLLLIAPSAHHRMRFRQRAKEDIIRTANFCALAGLGCVAVAVGAGVYLVTNVVYGSAFGGIVGGSLIALTFLLWFAVPLSFGRDDEPESHPPASPERREQAGSNGVHVVERG